MTNDKLLKALYSGAEHNLKVMHDNRVHTLIWVTSYETHPNCRILYKDHHEYEINVLINTVKPILYDLDLTKPIWKDGKEIDFWSGIMDIESEEEFTHFLETMDEESVSYIDIQALIEHRIDYLNLIPKDLAISVSSLKENPYAK